ncbi:MAG: ABC-2 transporter permease [Clostridia bacterium]|nr:ABC-2 transporter permease [Clostridia bacterium]
MLTLVLKDILTQKKKLWLIVFYGVFMHVALYSLGDAGAYGSATVGITYIFVLGACAHDDKNRSEILLNSLPISRNSLVMAKYLTSLWFLAIGLIASTLVGTVAHFTGLDRGLVDSETLGIMVFIGLLLVSFYYPVYFLFGYLKARYYHTLLFILAIFVPGLLATMANRVGLPGWLGYFLEWLNHSHGTMALGFIGAGLLLFIISLFISLKFYQKREFA